MSRISSPVTQKRYSKAGNLFVNKSGIINTTYMIRTFNVTYLYDCNDDLLCQHRMCLCPDVTMNYSIAVIRTLN